MSDDTLPVRKKTTWEIVEERYILLNEIEACEGDMSPELQQAISQNMKDAEDKARGVFFVMQEYEKDFKYLDEYIMQLEEKKAKALKGIKEQEERLLSLTKAFGAIDTKSKAEIPAKVFRIAPTEEGRKVISFYINYSKKIEKQPITLATIRKHPILKNYASGAMVLKVNDFETIEKTLSVIMPERTEDEIKAIAETSVKVELSVSSIAEKVKENLGIMPDYLEDFASVVINEKVKTK